MKYEHPSNPHAIVEIAALGAAPGDGQALSVLDSWEQKGLFQNITVDLVTNESSEATITFFDPNFRIINSFSNAFVTSRVAVYLGYGQDLGKPIFEGLLAQVNRGNSTTRFTAFDMGFKMKLVKKAGYKNKKNDLAILEALAKANGLEFEGPEEKLDLEPYKAMMQDEQTDWEHALERARDAGLVIFVRHNTLYAKLPAKITKPILTLINKKDFQIVHEIDFLYRTPISQDGRPRIVTSRRRGKSGKRIEGQSDDSKNKKRQELVLKRDISAPDKKKLSKRAQAQKNLEREHTIEAHVEILFPPDGTRLDVRNTVEILNVGKLFSGKYLCDAVNYDFAPGRLGVNLDLYRDII